MLRRSRCASAAEVRVLCFPPQHKRAGVAQGQSSRHLTGRPGFDALRPYQCRQDKRGVVERPQTAGFEPVHTGSNPVTPAIHHQSPSSAGRAALLQSDGREFEPLGDYQCARLAKPVDAQRRERCAARRAGSIPAAGTSSCVRSSAGRARLSKGRGR